MSAPESLAQVITDGSVGNGSSGLVPGGIDPNNGLDATYLIEPELGDLRGSNLFHSFLRFDIRENEVASFTGPNTIENVIARVTGGTSSQIDGKLRSTIDGADLYLINRSGVVFGENSSLDVQGNLFVSTAEALEFSSGTILRTGEATSIPMIDFGDPIRFGFLGGPDAVVEIDGPTALRNQNGAISIQAGTIRLSNGGTLLSFGLGPDPGGDIELVGGHLIEMSGTNIARAPSSISTSSFGDGDAGSISITAPTIRLRDSARISSTGAPTARGGSGRIIIRASEALELSGRGLAGSPTGVGASIVSTTSGTGDGGPVLIETPSLRLEDGAAIGSVVLAGASGAGADIRIESKGSLLIQGTPTPGDPVSASLVAETNSEGAGGRLEFVAGPKGNITIDQVRIGTQTTGSGSGGDVSIAAPGGQVTLLGTDTFDVDRVVFAVTAADGDAGNLEIQGDRILIDGASIFSTSFLKEDGSTIGVGDGGDIDLVATTSIELSGRDALGRGASVVSSTESEGNAGHIRLTAPTITIREGATIQADSLESGDAGSISIRADLGDQPGEVEISGFAVVSSAASGTGSTNQIGISGRAVLIDRARVTSNSFGSETAGDIAIDAIEIVELKGATLAVKSISGTGAAGSVVIRAPTIRIVDGSQVTATSTALNASAGSIDLVASQQIELGAGRGVDGATLVALSTFSGQDDTPASIRLDAPVIHLVDGAVINTDSLADDPGAAGTISIHAETELILSGRNDTNFGEGSQIRSNNEGGRIEVDTPLLRMEDGAELSTSTRRSGAGGTIRLDVERLEMRDASSITSSSRGSGDAGAIVIGPADGRRVTRSIDLSGGSTITTSSRAAPVPIVGAGAAGSVNLNVKGTVRLSDSSMTSVSETDGEAGFIVAVVSGKLQLSHAEISTSALNSGGGDIRLDVGDRLLLERGSRVTASVAAGTGGNVSISRPVAVVLRNASEIVARASTVPGTGGTIDIVADGVFVSPDSAISASAPGGPEVQGSVMISSPDADLDSQLTTLDSEFRDPSALIQPSCRASAGRRGSFSVERFEALQTPPDDVLLAFGSEPGPGRMGDALASTEGSLPGTIEEEAESTQLAGVEILRGIARAQHIRGRYGMSMETLQAAWSAAIVSADPGQMAEVLGAMGNVHVALGQTAKANDALERATALARDSGRLELASKLLNDYGNHLAAIRSFEPAIDAYRESAELAARAGQSVHEAKALSNGARAALDADDFVPGAQLLSRATARVQALPASSEKALILIHLAKSHEEFAAADARYRREGLLNAHQAIAASIALSEGMGNARTLSHALGSWGRLYQGEHRYEEALYFTQQALRAAQQAHATDAEYRWHWQAGQILWSEGRADDALHSYRRAVDILDTTRTETLAEFGSTQTNFRHRVAPVYLNLIDVLLQSADLVGDEASSMALLLEARDTMEHFKAAELRDYYRDDCIADLESRKQPLDEILAKARTAAVVYPLLLPDRTELLVSFPSGLRRYRVPVGRAEVMEMTRHHRRNIVLRPMKGYLTSGRKLYDWLVRPYEDDLRKSGIDTLVFVPEGLLLDLPMATLHDGEGFLIETYALAVTPGLSLVDPKPLDPERSELLMAGVSDGVQGFAPLAEVPAELEAIRAIFGGNILLDEAFTESSLDDALRISQPGIVHLATHAVFTGDPESSFLLTHDGRITMDGLAQLISRTKFGEEPLELLMLSACETAAGDDRAVLGLAGVAIRAGARSVVGSLWSVSDEATRELVVGFYRELKKPGVSRAVALQRAQREQIESERFSHPFYWSAFVLINNWL